MYDTCIAISYKCSIITVNLCNTLKVSAIFNDHSLESNMTLVINKLFLYEEKDLVIKYGNVKKSLEAVNKWNYRHLMKLPPGMNSYQSFIVVSLLLVLCVYLCILFHKK